MLGDDLLILINIGWIYGQLECYEDVVVIYDWLVCIELDWLGVWLNWFVVFLEIGMISEVVLDVRCVVEIEFENGLILNMLCWMLIQDDCVEIVFLFC